MNRTYQALDKVGFLKSGYLNKFLFVAFVGIHIPLLSIIVLLIYNEQISKSSVFVILLLFTLIATGVTLFVLQKLLSPLLVAKSNLEAYTAHQTLPQENISHHDEAGQLLKTINESISYFDQNIQDKDQITELFSHNMRIPFTQIKALTDVLSRQHHLKGNSEVDLINMICEHQLKNSEELFKNMNQRLMMTESALVNVEALLKKLLLSAESQLKNKNLEIVFECDSVSSFIPTEEQKLSLVFENILNNAIKFSFPGQKIYISCQRETTFYSIVVRDEGIGFPSDFNEKIFLPNTNTGRVGTMGEPSNGIGLNLSRRNIQKLGGDILAFSKGDNQGAAFTIIISIDQAS